MLVGLRRAWARCSPPEWGGGGERGLGSDGWRLYQGKGGCNLTEEDRDGGTVLMVSGVKGVGVGGWEGRIRRRCGPTEGFKDGKFVLRRQE